MCEPVKDGFLYKMAQCLQAVVPGRVGELFYPLSMDGGVYVPHFLENMGVRQIELALRATIATIAVRHRMIDAVYDYLDDTFDRLTATDEELSPEEIAKLAEEVVNLLADISKEIVHEEGLANSPKAVDLKQGSHFMVFAMIILLFRQCLANSPHVSYEFLGNTTAILAKEVEAAVGPAINAAVNDGLGRIKAVIGEEEFKEIVREETMMALKKFTPRIGKIVLMYAIGYAVEAALKRADEIALAKIPPLPKIKR